MRKIKLYIAASLDGFIARPDGDTSWLHADKYTLPNEDFGYKKFYDTIDTTLMGNSTYKSILGFDVPFPYPDKTNYVFSKDKNNVDTKYVQFVANDSVEFIKQLKTQQGKDIWLVGGGYLNTLLLRNNLIDEIVLAVIPTMLGQGIPLFREYDKEINFRVIGNKSFENGINQLTMTFEKP